MTTKEQNFNIVIPAELSKNADGDWRVRGLASTASKDQQGEVILQNGIDTSTIDSGKAYFNWDHKKGPENILGPIDTYQKTGQGLVVEGRLFKNHEKAKAVYGIMSSLGKSDQGRMGMSVEGSIKSRDGADGKVIKECVVKAVALTMNPVNVDTYADLCKSLNGADSFDFTTDTPESDIDPEYAEATFTAAQVTELVKKALTAGAPGTQVPSDLSGGEALGKECLDSDAKDVIKPPKKKKLKKMSKEIYKSNIVQVLDNIQNLYPNHSRNDLWAALKDRLTRTFPELTRDDVN